MCSSQEIFFGWDFCWTSAVSPHGCDLSMKVYIPEETARYLCMQNICKAKGYLVKCYPWPQNASPCIMVILLISTKRILHVRQISSSYPQSNELNSTAFAPLLAEWAGMSMFIFYHSSWPTMVQVDKNMAQFTKSKMLKTTASDL